jgi:ABC-type multidrug transport system fused ATPase/permease subunit
MAIGGVIMAVQKDAKLTWVLVVVIPILAVIISVTAAKGLPLFRSIQAKIDRINLVLRENLTGEMHVGSLMAFIQYAMQILFSLLMVSFLFVMLPRSDRIRRRGISSFAR